MAEETGLSTMGMITPEDYQKFTAMQQYSDPMISPWVSLGAGLLLGLVKQKQQQKQHKRDVRLASDMAKIPKSMRGQPVPMPGQSPSGVSNLLGGVATAFNTAGGINKYSAFKNIRDAIAKEKLEKQNAALDISQNPYTNPDFMGPPTEEQMALQPDQYSPWNEMSMGPPTEAYMMQNNQLMDPYGYIPYTTAAPNPAWAPKGM